MAEIPIVDAILKIQKFEGKGGWHYVIIDDDLTKYKQKGGWVKVRGFIDSYELLTYNLAPTGKGKFILPITQKVRKVINKNESEAVHIILFHDKSRYLVPEFINEILEDYPTAKVFFDTLTDSNKSYYIDYIQEAKSEITQLNRINTMINRLEKNKKRYDL